MNINRREVLKGGLASLGFLALDGLPVYAALLAVAGNPEFRPDAKIQTYMDEVDTGGKVVMSACCDGGGEEEER